jgi:hypothetical protein
MPVRTDLVVLGAMLAASYLAQTGLAQSQASPQAGDNKGPVPNQKWTLGGNTDHKALSPIDFRDTMGLLLLAFATAIAAGEPLSLCQQQLRAALGVRSRACGYQ